MSVGQEDLFIYEGWKYDVVADVVQAIIACKILQACFSIVSAILGLSIAIVKICFVSETCFVAKTRCYRYKLVRTLEGHLHRLLVVLR